MENSENRNEVSSQPELSIIVPFFKGDESSENTINHSIANIKNISYEFIVLCEYSTDGESEFLKNIAKNVNVNVHNLPENIDSSAAKNIGISLARGKYITFLDAGDVVYWPISDMFQVIRKEEPDVLHSNGHFVTGPDQYVHLDGMTAMSPIREFNIDGYQHVVLQGTSKDNLRYFMNNMFHWAICGKIYRRDFLLECDIKFPEDIRLHEDVFFTLQSLMRAKRYFLHDSTFYIQTGEKNHAIGKMSPEDALKYILEDEVRGLNLLKEMFSDPLYRDLFSFTKAHYCDQMDKIIGPITLAKPELWEKMQAEDIALFRDPWWITRYLDGWHRLFLEKQRLLTENRQQQAAIAATDELLDRTLKIPRIILLASVYTMLLCLLYYKDWDKSIFICGGGIPSSIIQNLRKQGIICYGDGDGKFINDINTLQALVRYAERNHIPVAGNDDSPEGGVFIHLNFTVVEEGIGNYRHEAAMKRKNAKRVTTNGEVYVPFGFNKFTDHILLTGKEPIPEFFKDKAEIINIQQLWNKKSKREQEKILEVYSFPRKELEHEIRKGRDCLLIGNPYAAVGMCKEEQEIALYREMMEPYGEKRVIIKPHHQNSIDLKKYFPDCYILPKEFPIDLAKLLNLKLSRVIGTGSSVLYGLFHPSIVEDRKNLMEKYGITFGSVITEKTDEKKTSENA